MAACKAPRSTPVCPPDTILISFLCITFPINDLYFELAFLPETSLANYIKLRTIGDMAGKRVGHPRIVQVVELLGPTRPPLVTLLRNARCARRICARLYWVAFDTRLTYLFGALGERALPFCATFRGCCTIRGCTPLSTLKTNPGLGVPNIILNHGYRRTPQPTSSEHTQGPTLLPFSAADSPCPH